MSRADGSGVVPSVGTERADMAGRAATGHAGSEPPDRAGAGCTEAWHAGGRSCPAGRRGGGCIRRGQAGYPYGRPVWCRSADRTFGGEVDAVRAILAGDGSGGSGGGGASL